MGRRRTRRAAPVPRRTVGARRLNEGRIPHTDQDPGRIWRVFLRNKQNTRHFLPRFLRRWKSCGAGLREAPFPRNIIDRGSSCPYLTASIAQLVEHRSRKAGVIGSSPIAGSSDMKTPSATRAFLVSGFAFAAWLPPLPRSTNQKRRITRWSTSNSKATPELCDAFLNRRSPMLTLSSSLTSGSSVSRTL